MTKSEIAAIVAGKSGVSVKDADKVISLLTEEIANALSKGEKIQFIGFGTFEIRERAARIGKNPRTGEKLEIAASKLPAFKAGKSLKDRVK